MNRPAPKPEYLPRILVESGLEVPKDLPFLVGRRGYYDKMGQQGNDLGIYDDAIFAVDPDGTVLGFNANTDPSSDVTKGMATLLAPQAVRFALGIHNASKPPERRYKALVQAGKVVIHRHDTAEFKNGFDHSEYGMCLGDEKWTNSARVPSFGINNHHGGENTTTSAGCQTVLLSQWEEYLKWVEDRMAKYNMKTIDYLLTAYEA